MRLVFAFLLVAVVLLSGCTVPGTDIDIPGIPDFLGGLGGNKGKADVIIIKELKAYPEKVEADETVKLIAQVQNVGKEAFDVVNTPETGNDAFDSVDKALETVAGGGYNKKVKVLLYDSCSGLLTVVPSSQGAHASLPKTSATTIQPQEIAQFEWTLKAGSPPVQTKCDLRVMVKYGFVTQSATSITFIDPAEYARQLQDNSFRTTSSTTTIGDGPIRTYLTVEDRQPIPSNTNAKIELQLKEEGSGFAAFVDSTDAKTKVHFKKESVTVTALGLKSEAGVDCFLKAKPEDALTSIDKTNLGKDQTLLREKTAPLRCAVEYKGGGGSGVVVNPTFKEQTALMTVEAKYVYEFRKEVKVTVEPKVK